MCYKENLISYVRQNQPWSKNNDKIKRKLYFISYNLSKILEVSTWLMDYFLEAQNTHSSYHTDCIHSTSLAWSIISMAHWISLFAFNFPWNKDINLPLKLKLDTMLYTSYVARSWLALNEFSSYFAKLIEFEIKKLIRIDKL